MSSHCSCCDRPASTLAEKAPSVGAATRRGGCEPSHARLQLHCNPCKKAPALPHAQMCRMVRQHARKTARTRASQRPETHSPRTATDIFSRSSLLRKVHRELLLSSRLWRRVPFSLPQSNPTAAGALSSTILQRLFLAAAQCAFSRLLCRSWHMFG